MPDLQLINTQTITSSITSIDFDNVFSDTYDVYKITHANLSTAGTTNNSTGLRFLDSSGTVIDQSEYDYVHQVLRTNTSYGDVRATGQTSILDFFGATDQAPEAVGGVGYVFNPFDSSSFTYVQNQNSIAVAGVFRGFKAIGVHKSAESVRGFRATFSQAVDSGTISIFGVK